LEKKKPHCPLAIVKQLVAADRVSATRVARIGATALGFDFDGMCAVLSKLEKTDFYKSMTSHNDHRVWQDVYRPQTDVGQVYIKLTVIDDVLIVSFKEL
jgi:motility quorum-sensing regulator / GCU-specific mRNA interferase toxin